MNHQPVVDLQDALREYFGFNQFKDEQEAIIQTVMDGRDCLVIMPRHILTECTHRANNRP